MSDATVGMLLDDTATRDAIHFAIAPVVAAEKMPPGKDIGLLADGRAAMTSDTLLGIVDPFLRAHVQPGQRFWMFLYPRTITSLRHVWTHPDFPEEGTRHGSKEESEEWLRSFIERSDCPRYEILIAAATGEPVPGDDDDYYSARLTNEYLHFGGYDAHGEIPPEFWDHVEVVTGRKMQVRPTYFSCSC